WSAWPWRIERCAHHLLGPLLLIWWSGCRFGLTGSGHGVASTRGVRWNCECCSRDDSLERAIPRAIRVAAVLPWKRASRGNTGAKFRVLDSSHERPISMAEVGEFGALGGAFGVGSSGQ